METSIHYLTDEAGNPTAVQIPFTLWKAHFQKAYESLAEKSCASKEKVMKEEDEAKLAFRASLKQALQEGREIAKNPEKATTLDDLLNEL